MKHSFLDKYSDRDSFVHRLDSRAKLITVFLFILAVNLVSLSIWESFLVYFIVITLLIAVSKVPPLYVLKRSLTVMPFVLMVAIFIPFFKEGDVIATYTLWRWQISATSRGLETLSAVLIKAWLSMLSLIFLTSTTKITSLLAGMEQLRFPKVMVMILSFMYRYIFILTDEVMKMRQGRDSRNFGRAPRSVQLRTVGNMIGTLFIRSFERSERVYAAMVSRGFTGECHTLNHLRFGLIDAFFIAGFAVLIFLVFLSNLVF